MADKEEYWDVYDRDKKLTGRVMKRNDWTMAEGDYHLTVLGILQNRAGRYLITKRARDKVWAPGDWEIPGGGVMVGETSLEAVQRELLEETGIDVRGAEGGFLFDYHREDPHEANNYFVDVYKFVLDFGASEVHLQEEETDGFLLATYEQIRGFASQGRFLHYESMKRAFV